MNTTKNSKFENLIRFLEKDIWRIQARRLSRGKSFVIRLARAIILSIREFTENQSVLRASALTFYSLLSIVPVLAMIFGVAKGFGFEKILEERLLEQFRGQEEVITRAINFSRNMLENTSGGIIAGIGIAILFWSVIGMLSNIEKSFNRIWGVKTQRSFARKFTDYLSLFLIGPVLLIITGGINVFVTSQLQSLTSGSGFLYIHFGKFVNYIGPVAFIILSIVPYAIVCGFLTFLYIFMPNTKVKFSSAFLGGLVAGIGFQLIQWIYIASQIGINRFGPVYGSFAALPLFLTWLQLSWFIVLYGAELSFAHQNEETYEFEPDAVDASIQYKRLVTLRIAQIALQHFVEKKGPINEALLGDMLEVPIRVIRESLYELCSVGALNEIVSKSDSKIKTYQPGWPPEEYKVYNIIRAIETKPDETLPMEKSAELKTLKSHLNKIDEDMEKSRGNVPLTGSK